MTHSATITSKRQLTIPARIFRAAKLREGERVHITYHDGALMVEPARALVRRLAGSVSVPARQRHVGLDTLIRRSRAAYFGKRRA